MTALPPCGVPAELLERVASATRIRALASMLDDTAVLEDGTVEVRVRLFL